MLSKILMLIRHPLNSAKKLGGEEAFVLFLNCMLVYDYEAYNIIKKTLDRTTTEVNIIQI